MSRGWYVLHVYTGYEKKVESKIKDMVSQEDLENIYEVKVPIKKIQVEMKNNKKKEKEENILPGYILIDMDMPSEWKDIYYKLKRINGVSGFTGANKDMKPIPISEDEVKKLFYSIEQNKSKIILDKNQSFIEGEVVKIIEGPFSDFNGKISKVDSDKNKLKVMVAILGRDTPVDLNFSQVKKFQKNTKL